MNIQFNTSSSAGVSNTGSSSNLVQYLEKEGKGQFFSHDEKDIKAEKVQQTIDNIPKSNLKKKDWKFIEIEINPSQKELQALIHDRLNIQVNDISQLNNNQIEIIKEELIKFAREVQNLQAINYNRNEINSGNDLIYFGRVEVNRKYKGFDDEVKQGKAKSGDLKKGLNFHVHLIQGRKTKNGKMISPLSNFKRKSNKNSIKQGFNRVEFITGVEHKFDFMFKHNRDLADTLKYRAKKKYGSNHVIGNTIKDDLKKYKFSNYGNFIDLLKSKDIEFTSDDKKFYIEDKGTKVILNREDIASMFTNKFNSDDLDELKLNIENASKNNVNFNDLKIDLSKKNIHLDLKVDSNNKPYGYVAIDNNTGIVMSGSKLYSLSYMKRDFDFNLKNGVTSSNKLDELVNKFTVKNNFGKRILNNYFLKRYNYNAWNKIIINKNKSSFNYINHEALIKSKVGINQLDKNYYTVDEQNGIININNLEREQSLNTLKRKLNDLTVSNIDKKIALVNYIKEKYYYNAWNDIKVDLESKEKDAKEFNLADIELYSFKDKLGVEQNYYINTKDFSIRNTGELNYEHIKSIAERFSYSNEEEKKVILDYFKDKYNYNAEKDLKFSNENSSFSEQNDTEKKNTISYISDTGKKYKFHSSGKVYRSNNINYDNNLIYSNKFTGSTFLGFASVAKGYANSYAQDKPDNNKSKKSKKKGYRR